MRLQVVQETLTGALDVVRRAVPGRSTMPIYLSVLIIGDDDGIRVAASNGVTTVVTRVVGEVRMPGGCLVKAKRFIKYVETLPAGEITLELIKNDLRVQASESSAKFNTRDAADFVRLPEPVNGQELVSAKLQDALGKVGSCMSDDASHPTLTGVLHKFDGDDLYLAATDGTRLSRTYIRGADNVAPVEVVVPPEAVDLIEHLDPAATLTLAPIDQGRQMIISTHDTVISTSLIAGNFPDAERMIPAVAEGNWPLSLAFDVSLMRDALARALIFAAQVDDFVVFSIGDDYIEVHARDTEGSGRSMVGATVICDGLRSFGINGSILDEYLKVSSTERVELLATTDKAPLLLREIEGDRDYLTVIMPMSLKRPTPVAKGT